MKERKIIIVTSFLECIIKGDKRQGRETGDGWSEGLD